MLIHVFEDTPHHYQPMRQFFTQQCDVSQEQQFWVRVATNDNAVIEKNADQGFVSYSSAKNLISRLAELPKSSQFIFHGLADVNIYWRLFLSPIRSRCSCIIWGYELYRYNENHRTIKQHLVQWLHRVIIAKLKRVFTLTPGDAHLVQQFLKRNNNQVLPYPGIGLTDLEVKAKQSDSQRDIRILVGNSAAQSNQHIDAFEQLKHLANENIEIIVPLNYAGEPEYIDEVISKGQSIFGKKFTAITEMLTKAQYDELLTAIDLTVFAHQRQQGLYVVYAMLLMGKHVYLRKETTSYKNFTSLGFLIPSFESLSTTNIKEINKQVSKTEVLNQTLMNRHFTEQALAPQWSSMLNDLFKDSDFNEL